MVFLHKKSITIITLASYFCLTGFFYTNPVEKVNDFLQQTKNDPILQKKITLPPLVSLKAYHPVIYQGQQVKPFALKSFVISTDREAPLEDSTQCNSPDCGALPPEPHEHYFLENYALSDLYMVGMMERTGKLIALIQTPDSGVLNIKVGDYIGKNNGKVEEISKSYIDILEKIQVPGGWQDRSVRLPLSQPVSE